MRIHGGAIALIIRLGKIVEKREESQPRGEVSGQADTKTQNFVRFDSLKEIKS
jgi:hypothetical protein